MKALFTGNVSPKAQNIKELFKKGDIETLFSDVTTLFKGNDLNFVNLECAITESDKEIEKFGSPLKAPLETARVLKELGMTVCGVSNNHIFDYGVKGWSDYCKEIGKFYTESIQFAYSDGKEDSIKRFGHYLDCEAHSDVWKELNKTANHTNEK